MSKKMIVAVATLTAAGVAYAQFPVMDRVADKVVQKYQTSTCEQLWQEKAQKQGQPKPEMEQDAQLPGRRQPLLRGAQRRHAVHRGLARRVQGAVDLQHPRHGEPLLHHADALRLVRGVQGGGFEHDGRQAAGVRDHGPRLGGHAAQGR